LSKIKFLVKNQISCKKCISCQKSTFLSKTKNYLSKIKVLVKNQISCQKSNLLSKIKFLVKKWISCQKSSFLSSKNCKNLGVWRRSRDLDLLRLLSRSLSPPLSPRRSPPPRLKNRTKINGRKSDENGRNRNNRHPKKWCKKVTRHQNFFERKIWVTITWWEIMWR